MCKTKIISFSAIIQNTDLWMAPVEVGYLLVEWRGPPVSQRAWSYFNICTLIDSPYIVSQSLCTYHLCAPRCIPPHHHSNHVSHPHYPSNHPSTPTIIQTTSPTHTSPSFNTATTVPLSVITLWVGSSDIVVVADVPLSTRRLDSASATLKQTK